MRYVYLAALIALIAFGAKALAALSEGAFPLAQDSAILLYLLAGFLIVSVALLRRPESVKRFVRQYFGAIGISALGFLLMFGLGLAMLFGLSALLMSTGRAALVSDMASESLGPLLLAAVLSTAGATAVAIPEELLFRGFIVSYLRWSTSALVTIGAVSSSALLFAFAHNLTDPLAWFTADELPLFIGLFLLGVLLAVAYLVTKSLWCPIGLHAALVAFNSAILETKVLTIDLSPWWLGASDDVRQAPLVWLSFIIASCLLIVSQRWLSRHLAIETPFVGALTVRFDRQAPSVRLEAKADSPRSVAQGVTGFP